MVEGEKVSIRMVSLLSIACVLFAWSGGAIRQPCSDVSKMHDRDLLLLIRCIPIGSRPEGIAKLAPGFLTTRSFSDYSLSTGSTAVNLLGHKVYLTFNLKADSLYGMYYHADLSESAGDCLFEYLVAFYTREYGRARVGDGQDEPYFVKDRHWCTSAYEVGVSCSMADKRRLLGWGFQTPVNCAKARGAKRK